MQSVKEKKERALGAKLFIKAERCSSSKCVMIRRPYRPGMHGQKRRSVSDYGRELQEKQKIQLVYGLTNRQMQKLFKEFGRGEIFKILEKRLDRVVYLLCFVRSSRVSRQIISHGHVLVNGRKVTIPSYRVRIGDVINIRPKSRGLAIFDEAPIKLKQFSHPSWLKTDPVDFKGGCIAEPQLESKQFPFDLNLVGQFYSH